MTTLKAIKTRKKSVQSTKKITMAMKMVAAAKLRRCEEHVQSSRPYAHLMQRMLSDLSRKIQALETPQPLLTGTGQSNVHLIVVATSDRGLCGGFNANIVRHCKKLIKKLQERGQEVQLLCIGRKARDMLRMEYKDLIVNTITQLGSPRLRYNHAQEVQDDILTRFNAGEFDVCTILYNQYVSAMTQVVREDQLIPLQLKDLDEAEASTTSEPQAIYEYEPSEEAILKELLPSNLTVQIFIALLENAASEQGARMTAMDNASRNAEDMIKKLELTYNRTRQAQITKELIEIISGAEAI